MTVDERTDELMITVDGKTDELTNTIPINKLPMSIDHVRFTFIDYG